MMQDLRRRIDRLEKRMTDGSRLAPESQEWFDYWHGLLNRRDEGEDVELPGEIPWPIIRRECGRECHLMIGTCEMMVARPIKGLTSDRSCI